MQIKSVELVNFCQYENRTFVFTPGTNAIIGPNGSGKSNILSAINYALLGQPSTAGNKSANIYNKADPSARAYITVLLEHKGTEVSVTRDLKSSGKDTVTIGKETYNGSVEVTNKLLEFLGVVPSTVSDVCIVHQTDLFGVLDKTPAKRIDLLVKLFSLDEAQKAYNTMQTFINAQTVEDYTQQLELLNSQISESVTAMQELADGKPPGDAAALRAAIEANNQAAQVAHWREQIEKNMQHDQAALQQAEASYPRIEEARVQAHTALAGVKAELDSLDQYIREFDSLNQNYFRWKRTKEKRDAAQAGLEAAESVFKSIGMSEQAVPGLAEEIDKHQREIASLQAGLAVWQSQLDTAKSGKPCPTCYRDFDNREQVMQDLQQKIDSTQSKIKATTNRLLGTRELHNQIKLAADKKQNAVAILNAIHDEPEPQAPTDLSVSVQQRDRLASTDFREATEKADIANRAASAATRTMDALRGKLESFRKQLSQLPVVENVNAEDNTVLLQQLNNLEHWRKTYDDTATKLQLLQQQLAVVEPKHLQAVKKKEALSKLSKIKDVFHRTQAPTKVMHDNLAALTDATNSYLSNFGIEFMLDITAEADFNIKFPDGNEHAASRLSGGQQVSLVTCFRLAVAELFSPLGFVALDEPTAYLDSDKIKAFAPLLQELARVAGSTELQCIIVTHELSLAPTFNNVIDLNK